LPAGSPLVTVCVPTIGRTATLEKTLESLVRQSYSQCEILLLDNAAPSSAAAILDDYARSDPRATVLRSTKRIDMFENFQRGVDAATGRYLTFFHDDDVYGREFVSTSVALLEAHPSVAFTGSNCVVIDGAGGHLSNRDLVRRTEVWDGWRYIRSLFALGNNILPMPAVMFRRSLLTPNTFEPSQGVHFSDFFILMRLAEENEVGLIGERLMELRMHDEQASQRMPADAALTLRTRLFYEYCDELLARHPARSADIERLRGQVRSARRSAAVWMWMTAISADRADAARALLDGPGLDRWVRRGLSVADRSGASRAIRNTRARRRVQELVYSLVARARR
jgi:glycosyltransferase involved in cell wall biosynthesis